MLIILMILYLYLAILIYFTVVINLRYSKRMYKRTRTIFASDLVNV